MNAQELKDTALFDINVLLHLLRRGGDYNIIFFDNVSCRSTYEWHCGLEFRTSTREKRVFFVGYDKHQQHQLEKAQLFLGAFNGKPTSVYNTLDLTWIKIDEKKSFFTTGTNVHTNCVTYDRARDVYDYVEQNIRILLI